MHNHHSVSADPAPHRPGRRMVLLGAVGLAAGLATGCSPAPDLSEGESGRVTRVSDGDLIALDSGLRVRLAEIEAPAPGYRDRLDEPHATEAQTLLSGVALGRRARLWYGGLSRDRYDRAIAHVIASDEMGRDVWLNGFMARQGGARVRTWPDNTRRVRRLYALEAEAREAKRGLWALDHYRVRDVRDLADPPPFLILEAMLLEMQAAPGDGHAEIAPGGVRLVAGQRLGAPDRELKLAPGARIRLRGRLDDRGEVPLIRLSHWAQVEMAG